MTVQKLQEGLDTAELIVTFKALVDLVTDSKKMAAFLADVGTLKEVSDKLTETREKFAAATLALAKATDQAKVNQAMLDSFAAREAAIAEKEAKLDKDLNAMNRDRAAAAELLEANKAQKARQDRDAATIADDKERAADARKAAEAHQQDYEKLVAEYKEKLAKLAEV